MTGTEFTFAWSSAASALAGVVVGAITQYLILRRHQRREALNDAFDRATKLYEVIAETIAEFSLLRVVPTNGTMLNREQMTTTVARLEGSLMFVLAMLLPEAAKRSSAHASRSSRYVEGGQHQRRRRSDRPLSPRAHQGAYRRAHLRRRTDGETATLMPGQVLPDDRREPIMAASRQPAPVKTKLSELPRHTMDATFTPLSALPVGNGSSRSLGTFRWPVRLSHPVVAVRSDCMRHRLASAPTAGAQKVGEDHYSDHPRYHRDHVDRRGRREVLAVTQLQIHDVSHRTDRGRRKPGRSITAPSPPWCQSPGNCCRQPQKFPA